MRGGGCGVMPCIRVVSMAVLRPDSVMAFGVLASGKAFVEIFPRPSKFAHADFRGIVRAADPAFQILKMVAHRNPEWLCRGIGGRCKPHPIFIAASGLFSRGRIQ